MCTVHGTRIHAPCVCSFLFTILSVCILEVLFLPILLLMTYFILSIYIAL